MAKVSLGTITPSYLSVAVCYDFVDGVVMVSSGASSDSVVRGCFGVVPPELCRKKSRRRQMRTPANTLSKFSFTFPKNYLIAS